MKIYYSFFLRKDVIIMSEAGGDQKIGILEKIEEEMRAKYPGLPETEIVGSQAWKDSVQGGCALHFIDTIKGAGKFVKGVSKQKV
jgi:hypothetical protein